MIINKYTISFILFLLLGCTNKKEVKLYYPDGALQATYTEINGIKEGKYTEYQQSGEKGVEYFFKDGFENGTISAYYKNGNVARKGQFIWGEPIGSYFYYNENNQLDSVIEYILWPENETAFEYLERDTITKEIAQNAQLYINARVIFDENGKIDMEKSLYYEVSFDPVVKNDSIRFYLSFSNPYKYYGYNCDSIEIINYFNNIKDQKEISYNVYSRKDPIHLTGVDKIKKGKQFFYSIITLHYNDSVREVLIKVPFETGKFENLETRKFTPLYNIH